MAKKAVIVNVEKIEDVFVASYESGATKKVTVDTMPGTIHTWIESNAPELLRVAPTAEELAEAEWLEATEEEEIRTATFNLVTTIPELAQQTFEAPAVVAETETETAEETQGTAITLVAEEATEETIIDEEPKKEATDILGAIVSTVTVTVQAVAPVVGQIAQAVTAVAPTVAMWTVDQLSALWFVLSTYLPIYVEKLATLTVWVAWPKTKKAARKARKAVRAIAPVIWNGTKAVAGGTLAGLLVGAGAIWTAAKATAKVAKAAAREVRSGWSLKKELDAEWAA